MKLIFADGTVRTIKSRVNRPDKFSGVMEYNNGSTEWFIDGKQYLEVYEDGTCFFNPFFYEPIPPAPIGYKLNV